MVKFKIECSFKIESSHAINQPGFYGDNEMELVCPFETHDCFGQPVTNIKVIRKQAKTYGLIVITESLLDENEQKKYVEKLAELFTFILNKSELNPAYGNHIIKINWIDYFSVKIAE